MRSRHSWLPPATVVVAALGLGCGTTNRTAGDSVSERHEYEGTAERQLARLGARIDSLDQALDSASVKTKTEIHQELDSLRVKRQEASRKLADLESAGAERWNDAKRGLSDALDDLDRRFDRMRSQLRSSTR